MSEPASHWVPSPLLLRPQQTPRFLRAAWDSQQAQAFGPWRVAERIDPALALEQGPPPGVEFEALPAPDEAIDAPGAEIIEAHAEPVQSPGISAEVLQEAEQRAHAQGLQDGRAQVLAEIEADRAREAELVRHLAIELRALKEDPSRFFEPLRRLALHIAEQLVRGELQTSGEAVSQIVRQALDTLGEPGEDVVVTLNPHDAALLQSSSQDFLLGLRVQPDAALHRGSVRVTQRDTLVEDLIEHRLESIVHRVLAQSATAVSDSVLLRDTLSAEVVEDPSPLREDRTDRLRRERFGIGEIIDAAAIPVPPSAADEGQDTP